MQKLLTASLIAIIPFFLTGGAIAQEEPQGDSLFPKSTTDEWMSAPYHLIYRDASEPHNLKDYLTTFGDNEDGIRNRLGEPLNRYVKEFPNRHLDGETNTKVRLEYDGLAIKLLRAPHRTFISGIYINDCQINSPLQSYLCQPVATVINRLGKPTVTTDNELIYTIQYGDIGTAPLRIGIKDDQTRWIYVRNYID